MSEEVYIKPSDLPPLQSLIGAALAPVVKDGITYKVEIPVLIAACKGEQGEQGNVGATGKGIASATYNPATGVLTLTFTDGSFFQTGNLRGAKGDTGERGEKGDRGDIGAEGNGIAQAAYNPATGVLTLTFTDSSVYQTGDLRGAKGDTGERGEKGERGDIGAEGKSAYQVAVDNGFAGTEAQWLASLVPTQQIADLTAEVGSISDVLDLINGEVQ